MTTPRTEAGRALLDDIRELAGVVHQTDSLRDHADPNDKTGWNLGPIETCLDPYCVEGRDASGPIRAIEAEAIREERARLADPRLREALEEAGFTPDSNVCSACGHRGGEHDLGNWCLTCPRPPTNVVRETFRARIDAGWCYFSSMDHDEKWAHGISLLRAALSDRDAEPVAPDQHPDAVYAREGLWRGPREEDTPNG